MTLKSDLDSAKVISKVYGTVALNLRLSSAKVISRSMALNLLGTMAHKLDLMVPRWSTS